MAKLGREGFYGMRSRFEQGVIHGHQERHFSREEPPAFRRISVSGSTFEVRIVDAKGVCQVREMILLFGNDLAQDFAQGEFA